MAQTPAESVEPVAAAPDVSTGVDRVCGIWGRLIDVAERRPIWFLAFWIALFGVAVVPDSRGPLLYDEVLTLYGATAKTLAQFYAGILHFDFNPPLMYALVSVVVHLFGDSPIIVRLPALLSFIGAAYLLFGYFRRRSGPSYGLLAVGVFFSVGFLDYGHLARPYATALFFFCLAFVSWSNAMARKGLSWQHAGIALGLAGMFLSHCFAAPFALPILVGELARTKSQKTGLGDKNIWIAIALPLPLLCLYLPLMQRPGAWFYAPDRLPHWADWFSFYGRLLLTNAPCLGLILAASLFIRPAIKMPRRQIFLRSEWVFLLTALAAPTLAIAYTVHAQVRFFDRYGIWIALPMTLLLVSIVERLSNRAPAAALFAAFLMCVNFCGQHLAVSAFIPEAVRIANDLAAAPPDLPIVIALGDTFLEMDHAGPAKLTSRLYYLTDPDAELSYTHASVFKDFQLIKSIYPVRGNVLPYSYFVSRYQHFLVVGDSSLTWVPRKMKDSGAELRTYPGTAFCVEVRMPSQRR